jgi:hypothetical protein
MDKPSKSGTFIHGCGATEHLDSSGERISIAGLDISSLERGDGVFNYEHKNDNASNVVGKVLKAKKIFSEKDCEDQNQLYFWNKAKAPFLYVAGELFDGVGHQQAQEVAAILKYDNIKRSENSPAKNTIHFSVEGAKLEKEGSVIKRAIARKISITIAPCNRSAIAEIMPQNQAKPVAKISNPVDAIFKFEAQEGVQILEKYEEPMKKAWNPSIVSREPGKHVVSFTHPEHGTVGIHQEGGSYHVKHSGALAGLKGVKGTFKTPKEAIIHAKSYMEAIGAGSVVPKSSATMPKLGKSSIGAAPGAMVGTNALSREKIIKKMRKSAEDAFASWPKSEELVKFVSMKHPDLSKNEIVALAKMMAWKQTQKAEKTLKALTSPEDVDTGVCKPVHEGNKVEELKKPYKSDAQRKWAHTPKGKKALGGKKAVEHWDKASKGKKLPEKIEKALDKNEATKYSPAYGQTKPHLSHEEMTRLGPKEHGRLAETHSAHSRTAAKDGRLSSGKSKEDRDHAQSLVFAHDSAARMHRGYAESRTGSDPNLRSQALAVAKKRHKELSESSKA